MMDPKDTHAKEIEQLQLQVRNHYVQRNPSLLSLQYGSKSSFTTRTKAYKNGCNIINCGALNQVIAIDPKNNKALVQPRVTMEALVRATSPYGLTPPVVPELKGITVGGAIMGMGAESGSHQWGTFNDTCSSFEILSGNGTIVRASPSENSDIFYGVPGSYGSLGALVSAEIDLIPAKDVVRLRYHTFNTPLEALEMLRSKESDPPDFLDGIIFAKDLAVVIEGNLVSKYHISDNLPVFSTNRASSPMYYEHVKKIALNNNTYEELMSHHDYFFRYDLGGFWLGSYLYHFPLLYRLMMEGVLHLSKPKQNWFNETETQRYRQLISPSMALRMLLRPIMSGNGLCKILHKAEKWIQNRFIIQDLCIPEKNAPSFMAEILDNPGVFPIWLLPLKGTRSPQIFAPHLISQRGERSRFVNFGVYGIPPYSTPMEKITRKLERDTLAYGGRKTLYSRSYYDQDEFWNIYPKDVYEALRKKMHADGVWHEITDKVLSE